MSVAFRRVVFPGNDVLWDLPSLVLGICYSYSQTALSFKADIGGKACQSTVQEIWKSEDVSVFTQ